jgi:hypothetical protein
MKESWLLAEEGRQMDKIRAGRWRCQNPGISKWNDQIAWAQTEFFLQHSAVQYSADARFACTLTC